MHELRSCCTKLPFSNFLLIFLICAIPDSGHRFRHYSTWFDYHSFSRQPSVSRSALKIVQCRKTSLIVVYRSCGDWWKSCGASLFWVFANNVIPPENRASLGAPIPREIYMGPFHVPELPKRLLQRIFVFFCKDGIVTWFLARCQNYCGPKLSPIKNYTTNGLQRRRMY